MDKKIFIGRDAKTNQVVWFGTHAKAVKVNDTGDAPLSLYAVLARSASYSSANHTISFLNEAGTTIFSLDAAPFIIDGMVDDVRIENGYLVIDFNTESGKQDISIPLTDIFDPSNYYNKTATDELLAGKLNVITQEQFDEIFND